MNIMKRMQKKASLLIIAAALSAALPAAAAETYQFHGDRAWTSFAESEADGCAFHSGNIEITANAEGRPQIAFSAYRYSSCPGGELQDFFALFGFADLPPDALKVQGNLQGATLNTTLLIEDEANGTSLPVTFAIEWTGLGDVRRGTYRSRYRDGNIFTRLISSGRTRDAQASGSVVVQGFEMFLNQNDGGLGSNHLGTTTRQGG